jgi:hypothetical protein
MTTRKLLPVLLLVAAMVALTLGGCGGSIDDDNGYDPHEPGYPQYKELTITLQVTNATGLPIGGAEVLIDGVADETTTDEQLHPLGEGYPTAWQGWLANWTSDAYEVVMNYEGDQDQFEIRVHKDGWTDDSTIVKIADYEPDHIFIRDEMIMHRITDVTSTAAKAPHYAEVTGGPTPLRLQSSPKPMKIIISTDDRVKAAK